MHNNSRRQVAMTGGGLQGEIGFVNVLPGVKQKEEFLGPVFDKKQREVATNLEVQLKKDEDDDLISSSKPFLKQLVNELANNKDAQDFLNEMEKFDQETDGNIDISDVKIMNLFGRMSVKMNKILDQKPDLKEDLRRTILEDVDKIKKKM